MFFVSRHNQRLVLNFESFGGLRFDHERRQTGEELPLNNGREKPLARRLVLQHNAFDILCPHHTAER